MAPSIIWNFFSKINKGRKVRCSLCKKEFVFCGSTTSFATHLAKVHRVPDIIKKEQHVEEIESSSSDENTEESEKKPPRQKPQPLRLLPPSPGPPRGPPPEQPPPEQPPPEQPPPIQLKPPPPLGLQQSLASRSKALAQKKPMSNSPIIEAFNLSSSFTSGGRRHAEVNNALLFMISKDCMPLCTPERKGFQRFCKALQPLYKLPSEKTTTKMMEEKFLTLKQNISQQLKGAKHITLTTDLWTETMSTRNFLGITAHFLEKTEMRSVAIGAQQMSVRKSIDNLSDALISITTSWKIDQENIICVVTDNGPNIVGACRKSFGANKHLACFAHTLNLVATKSIGFYDKCSDEELPEEEDSDNDTIPNETEPSLLKDIIKKLKKIVSFFRRCESAVTHLFQLQQTDWNKPLNECHKLIQEVRTRWNSLYLMIERYLQLHEFVSRVIRKICSDKSSKNKPPLDMTSDEIEALIEVKNVLQPLYMVTLELCAEKNVTVSKVIPLLKMLRNKIETFPASDPVAVILKSKLISNLNERFSNVEQNMILASATILDPRYKKIHFSSNIAVANTINTISRRVQKKINLYVNEIENARRVDPINCAKIQSFENSDANLWDLHDNLASIQQTTADQDTAGGAPIELRQYLNRPVCERFVDPLLEWEAMKKLYPHVYEVARESLSILATSVPSERLFSKAGQIMTKRRNRLSGNHLDQLIFLQSLDESQWFI